MLRMATQTRYFSPGDFEGRRPGVPGTLERYNVLGSTAGCGKPHVRWCGRVAGRNPAHSTRSLPRDAQQHNAVCYNLPRVVVAEGALVGVRPQVAHFMFA